MSSGLSYIRKTTGQVKLESEDTTSVRVWSFIDLKIGVCAVFCFNRAGPALSSFQRVLFVPQRSAGNNIHGFAGLEWLWNAETKEARRAKRILVGTRRL